MRAHRCRWPARWLLGAAGLLVIVIAACNVGGGPQRPLQGPVTAAIDDLSPALLTASDMPEGWQRHDSLRAGPPPDPTLLRATADAPALGSGSSSYVAHTVDLYQPGAGARAMQTLRAVFTPGDTLALPFPTVEDGPRLLRVYLWQLPFPALGDDSFAVWFEAQDGGTGAFVAIRREDTISMLRHFVPGVSDTTIDSRVTEQLARRADERLAALLQPGERARVARPCDPNAGAVGLHAIPEPAVGGRCGR